MKQMFVQWLLHDSLFRFSLIILCCLSTFTLGSEQDELQDILDEVSHNNLIPRLQVLESLLKSRHRYLNDHQLLDETYEEPEYLNEWVVTIPGGPPIAQALARENGYILLSQVRGFEDTYILTEAGDGSTRGKRQSPHITKRLIEDSRVSWVEQQRVQFRFKRDYQEINADILFNDPYWPKQWELHDTRTLPNLPKLDLHVMGAWKQGYTGKGISVSILDDGLQHNHTDLAKNYDPEASYDLNDDDTDPMPALNDYNRHGTRCAGEIAMVANNGVCGVGVAFNAKIGGIRMLDGKITDRLEAEALQFNIDHVDVFSASWGPNDDGRTVEGPGALAERALLNGITNGRGGKGIIYAWASGNGGSFADDCDCDGYTDSIFTLSISSASQSGYFPWYGEKCASTLATTYSSGAYSDQKITTTDLVDECTTDHTGTSASAPLAAGIVALGLEANPDLTWRDVQHITIWTSEPAPLMDNLGWHTNGRGLKANTRFGFGLMNAEGFVNASRSWITVPEQRICTTTFPTFEAKKFTAAENGIVKFRTDACQGQKNEINFLEHVQLIADIDYTRRGNLAIYIVSPSGTRTKLLSPRKRDNSRAGFRKWPFMSVHSWGEDPKGWWHLEVLDETSQSKTDFGSVNNLTLITYGTTEMPSHYKSGRHYDMQYNKVHDRQVKEQELKKHERAIVDLESRYESKEDEPKTAAEANKEREYLERVLRWTSYFTEENGPNKETDNTHIYSDTLSK